MVEADSPQIMIPCMFAETVEMRVGILRQLAVLAFVALLSQVHEASTRTRKTSREATRHFIEESRTNHVVHGLVLRSLALSFTHSRLASDQYDFHTATLTATRLTRVIAMFRRAFEINPL